MMELLARVKPWADNFCPRIISWDIFRCIREMALNKNDYIEVYVTTAEH